MGSEYKKTILLVEDEALIALLETNQLEKAGYQVIHSLTGEKAVEIVSANPSVIDLILMDIDLGKGIDGTQAAEQILRANEIPILFLSSHTEPEVVHKTEEITNYGYVVKASSFTVLDASIKMAFKLFAASRQLDLNSMEMEQTNERLQASLASLEKTNHQLSISEAMFSKIFHVNPDSMSRSRLVDGTYVDVNEGFTQMLGYERREVIGHSALPHDLDIWVNPEDRINLVQELKDKGEIGNFETEFRRKDGTILVGLMSANCIDIDAEPFLIASIKNITERKQNEQSLENRIAVLTSPLDDSDTISFSDLFKIDEIQKLQDDFSTATGVASVITQIDGTPITAPSNFCKLCTDIIRKNKAGKANCLKSDTALGRFKSKGPTIRTCMSGGLWDAGAGISVGGKHIANWLIGQVRDETQTEEIMLQYCSEIGADEISFLEAFREVPAMKHEKFKQIANTLFRLANQLSTLAYQNVQQARFLNEKEATEQALRESEERFHLLFNSTDSVNSLYEVVSDQDGNPVDYRYSEVNPAFEKLVDKKATELIGRTLLGVFPQTEQYWIDKFRDVVVGNKPTHFEQYSKELKTYAELSIFIPKKGQLAMTSTDITERKQIEIALQRKNEDYEAINEELRSTTEELQEKNQEYEAINEELRSTTEELQEKNEEYEAINEELKSTTDELQVQNEELVQSQHLLKASETKLLQAELLAKIGYWTLNIDTNTMIASNGADAIYGVDFQRVSLAEVQKIPLPEYRTTLDEALSDLILKDIPYDLEFKIKRQSDGAIVDIHSVAVFEKETSTVFGVMKDISDQKTTENELRKLSLGVAQSPVSIIITGIDGSIEYVNPKFVSQTGYSFQEAIGKNPRILQSGLTPKHQYKLLWDAIKANRPWSGELVNKKKNGQIYYDSASIATIKGENGEISNFIAISEDITQRKLDEQRIRSLLAEKELILKEVHHRITNNLNTIRSLLTLQCQALTEPSAIKALEVAEQRVRSLGILYEKLYRSENYSELLVKDYMSSLIDEILENFPNSEMVRLEKNIGDLVLEPKRLQALGLIINELLTTIMKYAFTGLNNGLISVSVESTNGHIVFSIQDNGIGMPEGIDFGNSSGFGLMLIDQLTKQLDGTIRIERGNGTKFVLEFDI